MTDQPARTLGGRVLSLDAYRGFVMLLLVSEGFFVVIFPRLFGDAEAWDWLASQFSHVPWVGCHLWDLIQPSFMFLVGTAIPFSFAARARRGDSASRIRLHAINRAFALILLGILVTSNGRSRTVFDFHNILGQIGLSYIFAFWLAGRSRLTQVSSMVAVLVGYWLAFVLYPVPNSDFDYTSVGLSADWSPLTGFFAHWNRNINLGTRFDQWFLNIFPRSEVYRYSHNGLQTLNFIPSIPTLGTGIMAGEVLRAREDAESIAIRFMVWGTGLVVSGLLAGQYVCPPVKAIWTPSWVLFSSGMALLLLALFHFVVEIRGHRSLVFPLIVAGANSISLYLMAMLLKPWLSQTVITHLGDSSWLLDQTVVFLILWGTCFWMYRRGIFLKL